MLQDLMTACQELEGMLSDLQENFTDFHPEDVIELLRNCELKAMELARDILAQRKYVHDEILPDWEITQGGSDAGMPPAVPPLVTGEGMDIS